MNDQFKRLQKLAGLVVEEKQTYDYGCVMLYFSFPEINRIHDAINPKHVYEEEGDNTHGLENEPHTTLLYGLHPGVTTEDIKKVLNKYSYPVCEISNPSLFKNEKFDVLKYDVKGENLHETNEDLKQHPHTTDYPDYHPHLTVGYLEKGMGDRYITMLNKAKANKFKLTPEYAVYSKPDGTKDKIEI
jgi:hypothetical protein